jgi:hypothetical protein
MINLSFSDVVERAKLLLGEKVDYLSPTKVFWSCNVLAPPDYKIGNGLLNVYLADPTHYPGSKLHSDCPHCLVIQATIDEMTQLVLAPPRDNPPHTDSALVQGFDVLLHLHESTRPCFTNDFCHVLGYRPTGSEHPGFISFFYQKWPNLRDL